jgi:hypothetical protein
MPHNILIPFSRIEFKLPLLRFDNDDFKVAFRNQRIPPAYPPFEASYNLITILWNDLVSIDNLKFSGAMRGKLGGGTKVVLELRSEAR